jgi:hypothetical protein
LSDLELAELGCVHFVGTICKADKTLCGEDFCTPMPPKI